MYEIPTSITVNGKQFNIRNRGDYRVVLDCFNALCDTELTKQERIISTLIIFFEDCNSVQDIRIFDDLETTIKEMYKFFNCGQTTLQGQHSDYRLLDWKTDEHLICSAINNVSHTEIRFEPYIHWWTFMGYYMAIGECPLSTIVNLRSKIVKGKKLEKYEKEFIQNNSQYFSGDYRSLETIEADKEIRQLWNKNKK